MSCDCHNYDGCRGNLGVCLERKIDHALLDVDILLTVCSRKKQTECLKQKVVYQKLISPMCSHKLWELIAQW